MFNFLAPRSTTHILTLTLAWGLLAYALQAQEFTPPSAPFVRVQGEANISAPPDRAQLDIGIISQAPSAKAVTDLNAKQSSAVIDQLRSVLSAANIKTVNFSVNPNYRFPKDGGTPETIGYAATNTIRVNVDTISMLPRVIEIATKAGASNVNRLEFELRDEAKVRARALAQAASQAHASAEALASSLKLRLGRVLRVEEGQPVIVSPARQVDISTVKASSADTPVEPGNINIHASVNVMFELIEKE